MQAYKNFLIQELSKLFYQTYSYTNAEVEKHLSQFSAEELHRELKLLRSLPDDSDVAEAMSFAQWLGVTIHIKGTDENPMIILLDKKTKKSINGLELRKRMKRLRD